jgi:membrane-associated protease RseP (regulator of RpoE activity)
MQVNSLLLAGWAGLILNALNCIPFGETDGGRIASALWGRYV